MTTRYVDSRSKASVQYGPDACSSPEKASKTLTAAIAAASEGDTVMIMDTGIYEEGEIGLSKGITIESEAWKKGPKPTEQGFKPESYPRLRPKPGARERVLSVRPAPGPDHPKKTLQKQVTLRGLTFEGGQSTNTEGEHALGGGAGVAIVDEDKVLLQDCCIRGNKATLQPLKKFFTVPFKDALLRRLKPLLDPLDRLMIPFAPLRISATKVSIMHAARGALDAKMPDQRDNHYLAAQASGGGVLFLGSSARMEGCLVQGNASDGRGGGVGVLGYGWPTIRRCVIEDNTAFIQRHARKDGGGVGLEVAIPERITRDLKEGDLLKRLSDWLDTSPAVEIAGMYAALQTVLQVALAGPGAWVPSGALDKVVDMLLYEYTRAHLVLAKDKYWNPKAIQEAKTQVVTLDRCILRKNKAVDDGGGLYASVLSRVSLTQCEVTDNVAESGAGGGLRASMGSEVTITGCVFERNRVMNEPTGKGKKGESKGGGGAIACRNSPLTIVGPTRIAENSTKRWAGGGLFIEAVSEGQMAGVENLWHPIMIEVFGVKQAPVKTTGQVLIIKNVAGDPRLPQTENEHAKAGGIYLLRGSFAKALPLEVSIEGYNANVYGNVAQRGKFKQDPPPHKWVEANNINLVDQHAHIDEGDVEVQARVKKNGSLPYPAR